MIQIQPLGKVDPGIIEWLAAELRKIFGEVIILPEAEIPEKCYNTYRKQYNSTCILTSIETSFVTLAITAEDIYANGMNFVFGEAEIGGLRAVVSYHRLRFFANEDLLKKRLLKEAIHELGHVFGLLHCKTRGCVMNFSNDVFEVDKKGSEFCQKCASRLRTS
ncbi:MAG: archaemetzincin family Zn-dependent metalloprotease [Archaeoglobaceae archaeon]